MKKIFRPVTLVLAALAVSAASALNLPVKTINGKQYYYYAVKRGETVLSVASKLGVTRDDIVRFNPGAADVLRQGSTLYLPVDVFKDIDMPAAESGSAQTVGHTFTYRVQRGETLFGVSHRFGVSPDEIIALNPSANSGIKAGQVLTMPANSRDIEGASAVAESDSPAAESPRTEVTAADIPSQVIAGMQPANEVNEPEQAETDEKVPEFPRQDEANLPRPVAGPTEIVSSAEEVAPAVVGVFLPLMLEQQSLSKDAKSATDFVRGFMLGLYEKRNSAAKVELHVYDTAAKPDTISTLLASQPMRNVQLIVGPEDVASFNTLVKAVSKHDVFILNLFAVQDSTYKVNEQIMQANVPNTIMFDKAADAMTTTFEGYTPVFLISRGGRSEKIPFTNVLRSRYAEMGVETLEISYEGMLTSGDLEKLDPDEKYLFIPASGSLTEFNKFSRAIANLRDSRGNRNDVALMGYPDWTTFKGDALEALHKLGAVIYSRFYADCESYAVKSFARAFKERYGEDMLVQVPSQALMGYDAARYIIANINANGGEFNPRWGEPFRGLQSSFMFIDEDENMNDGAANQAVYIITFQAGQDVDVQVL